MFGGKGFGIPVVIELIEMMRGEISFDSEV